MSSVQSFAPYILSFWRFDRRGVLTSLTLNLADALLAGVGLLMLLPLLSLAGVFGGTEQTPISWPAWIRHGLDDVPPDDKLLMMLGVFVGLIALQALVQLRRERHGQQLQLRFVDHLRESLFAAIAQARWRFLAQHHSSEFLSVLTTDIGRIGMGTHFLSQLFTQLLTFPVYLAVAFQLSPHVTGLALLTGTLLWALLRKSRDIAKQSGLLMSRANQGLFNELQEFLAALKLIKIHGEESGYQRQFQHAMGHLRDQQLEFNSVRTRSQLAFRIGGGLALASLTYAALVWAKVPAAKLLVLIAIFSRMLPQLSSIHMGFQQLWHMLPAFNTWQEWVRLCETERDVPLRQASATPGTRLSRDIQFVDVRYRHPNSDKTFSIPSLTIPAHKTTAIIGPTGSGKTTFLDLLCGLNEPHSGLMYVDGQAFTATVGWRQRLAYIPQETAILDGTLRDNLTWGHDQMDDPALWAALEQAAAGPFARQLPQGLDTWVGERGVRLSGGEKQRLAMARALLRKPELLILDEATSALDCEHQQIILEAIRNLHGLMTVLIVTHRHEEIRDLLDGQIQVDQGRMSAWQPMTPLRQNVPTLPSTQGT